MKAKRLFDIAFSAATLLLFIPFGLAIALAIKLSSKGPLFYGCERVGEHGKPFRCWKFRTMHVNAHEKLFRLLETDPEVKRYWLSYRKVKRDPRLTRVGRVLRRSSLDEFPQFWNVLKGDLSVVGPRPASPGEVEDFFGAKAPHLLSVKPGITGLWQISGRNLLPFSRRVELDEEYLASRSFLLDLWIIWRTIPALLSKKGAF